LQRLRPDTSAFVFFRAKKEKLKGKITAIKAGKNPRVRRSNIFLDGEFAFSLDNEVIVKELLKVGRELSPDYIQELTGADQSQRCLNAAFHFLSYRPRSEAETRMRLQRRGFETAEIEKCISRLKHLELINDAAFAEFWKDNRNSFRPRSQRAVKQELRQKGVKREVIDEVVANIDDAENAYQVAVAKARSLPVTDYQIFRRRLGGYLQRRGFSYGVINSAVKKCWLERTAIGEEQSGLIETVNSGE
jgi:regulatory protein